MAISGAGSILAGGKATSTKNRIAEWSAADMAVLLPMLALIHLVGDDGDGETRLPDPRENLGDVAVSGALVAAHPDLAAAASVADRGELRDEVVETDLGVLQEDLALRIDGDAQRRLLGLDRARFRLGQIDLGQLALRLDVNPNGEQRRRHHEDDEEHEHHVHHRGDVDLAHRRGRAAPSSPVRERTSWL